MNRVAKVFRSRLFNNIFNQFLLEGFSNLIPIILVPFLLNQIGVEKYGVINFALAFAFYFQVVNEFGFDLSNVRHVVLHRDDKHRLSEIFSSILCCKLGIILVSAFVYVLIVCILPDFRQLWLLYALAFVRLFGIILSPYWFFRSMEDIKYVTRAVLPAKIIATLPIFFIVHSADKYIWVMFFFALETILSGIISLAIIRKRYGLTFQRPSVQNLKFYMKDSFPFFTSTFLTRIYQNSNAVVLGFVCGEASVGIYTATEKLYNAYSSFVMPIITKVLYPYFSRIKDFVRINRAVLLIIGLNIVLLGLVYYLTPYLLDFFLKENVDEIISYFNLFLLLLMVSIPCELLGYTYLGVMGYVNKVNETAVYAALFYMLSAIVLTATHLVSISNLIFLLLATNLIRLIMLLRYIRIYKGRNTQ